MSLAGRELILGIRPEHMRLGGNNLSMEVETVEMLGAEHLDPWHRRRSRHDRAHRTTRQSSARLNVAIGLKAGGAHWFDPATTQRISP